MFGSKVPHGSARPHDPGRSIAASISWAPMPGRDQIFVWKLDTNSGKLNQVSVTKSVPGAGDTPFCFLAGRQDAVCRA